ncbi:MAG: Lrp/AsnC family transcriptional regulator [Austwickia sp.]|nr:Lrp/AsnC family transcriptional regulator [Austwickia sp.]MBK8437229.1 Lrp/AsnC family transcriptional regulator [Austwickia sp.]MBK9102463.1 Lrp/AsnC family transcriptional regulator [Austwickia sp.]
MSDATYRYDEIDTLILTALDEDARMTVMALADRCGLARGTVQARLERYRSLGLFRKHSVRIDPLHLSRGLSAMVSAELDQHQLGDAVVAVSRIPEVLECFAPAGETDLVCRVVARDPDDLYRVSEEIRLCPGIVRTRTSVFLRRVIPYRMDLLLAASRPARRPPD